MDKINTNRDNTDSGARESLEGLSDSTEAAEFPSKQSIPFLIQMLARMLTNDYMGRVSDDHLAPAQTYVLRELLIAGPMSQVDLARRLDIGKASVGETLVRLENAGLVTRERSTKDKRVILIQLTRKGRRIRSKLGEIAHDQVRMVEGLVGSDDAERLLELLTRLAVALKAESRARTL
jgi:DNA-binding MarR family transcriptional regulator